MPNGPINSFNLPPHCAKIMVGAGSFLENSWMALQAGQTFAAIGGCKHVVSMIGVKITHRKHGKI
jgi:hypothetical protein